MKHPLLQSLYQKSKQIALIHQKLGELLRAYEYRLLVAEICFINKQAAEIVDECDTLFEELRNELHLFKPDGKEYTADKPDAEIGLKKASQNPTLTDIYREIIRESGQKWLHVDQILIVLKKNYHIVRTKANVASVLRQGAKHQRNFMFHGKNRFGLLKNSIKT